MKRIINFLFSLQLAGIIMLVMILSMGIATFIENDFGSRAAQILVYNSIWFEILLVLLSVNIIGAIFMNKLLQRKKYGGFILHIAIIVILAGAGITRYFGYEGTMHIREGKTSNIIYTTTPYVWLKITKKDKEYYFKEKKNFSVFSKNRFKKEYSLNGDKVELKLDEFVPNPIQTGKKNSSVQNVYVFNIKYSGKEKKIVLHRSAGMYHYPRSFLIDSTEFMLNYGPIIINLPFTIKLESFILERYPGSESPSSYISKVKVIDKKRKLKKPFRIYMNNVLDYRGYRFFQSSYDNDEKGTILSVNHDYAGTSVTYAGYALLALGMIITFFNKNSRFRVLSRASRQLKEKNVKSAQMIIIAIIICTSSVSFASSSSETILTNKQISKEHAALFGKLLVQDMNGRIKPINTLSSELLRKISGKQNIQGYNPDQVLLGMLVNPAKWQSVPMIKIKNRGIRELLGIDSEHASFLDFFNLSSKSNYILSKYVGNAFRKKPAERNKLDKEFIKVDEKFNICYMAYSGSFLKVFPIPGDEKKQWLTDNKAVEYLDGEAALFVNNILPMYYDSVRYGINTGEWHKADRTLAYIKSYQEKYGRELIPSEDKIKMEVLYNKLNIFKRLSPFYGLTGFVLLIFVFIRLLSLNKTFRIPISILTGFIFSGFLFHTFGLVIRWYISGHAPWSNGYESMIYLSWATIMAGLIFIKKSKMALAATAVFSSLILMVAQLSWMDPQITNLVPVLKSFWLIIHVAVITASYGFLGLGALMGFFNLIIMSLKTEKNSKKINIRIKELTYIIEMTLIIGLVLLSTGTFLGAVWANESWGRYWGWDPKETWSLITILVYSFVLHMRIMPGLKGVFAFNLAALLSFSSVLMTYFGVNYYLSGLHSYAKGDPLSLPTFAYYSLIIILITGIFAYFNNKKEFHIKGKN